VTFRRSYVVALDLPSAHADTIAKGVNIGPSRYASRASTLPAFRAQGPEVGGQLFSKVNGVCRGNPRQALKKYLHG